MTRPGPSPSLHFNVCDHDQRSYELEKRDNPLASVTGILVQVLSEAVLILCSWPP